MPEGEDYDFDTVTYWAADYIEYLEQKIIELQKVQKFPSIGGLTTVRGKWYD